MKFSTNEETWLKGFSSRQICHGIWGWNIHIWPVPGRYREYGTLISAATENVFLLFVIHLPQHNKKDIKSHPFSPILLVSILPLVKSSVNINNFHRLFILLWILGRSLLCQKQSLDYSLIMVLLMFYPDSLAS